jgi:hypothetical protein
MKKNSNTLPLNMTALAVALFVAGISLVICSTSMNANKQRPEPLREDYATWRLIDEGLPGRPLVTNGQERPTELPGQFYLLRDRKPLTLIRKHTGALGASGSAPHLYRGVPGPMEYYPRRLYYLFELGPTAIPILLEPRWRSTSRSMLSGGNVRRRSEWDWHGRPAGSPR